MSDDEQPRWREWDEEEEPREWEIEPEEEKADRHRVLEGTAPLARVVFFAIVLAVVIVGFVTVGQALKRHFGGG